MNGFTIMGVLIGALFLWCRVAGAGRTVEDEDREMREEIEAVRKVSHHD